MSLSIGQYRKRIRELERINRWQSVEIWKLKEEKFELTRRIEGLLDGSNNLRERSSQDQKKVRFSDKDEVHLFTRNIGVQESDHGHLESNHAMGMGSGDGSDIEEVVTTVESVATKRRKGIASQEDVVPSKSVKDFHLLDRPQRLASKGKVKLGDKVKVSWGGRIYNCKVVVVRRSALKVHYLGWASEFDEWIPFPSSRLELNN